MRLYKESMEPSQGPGLFEVVVTRRASPRKSLEKAPRPPPMKEKEEEKEEAHG